MLSHANWPYRNDATRSLNEVEAKARPELVWKSFEDAPQAPARHESEEPASI